MLPKAPRKTNRDVIAFSVSDLWCPAQSKLYDGVVLHFYYGGRGRAFLRERGLSTFDWKWVVDDMHIVVRQDNTGPMPYEEAWQPVINAAYRRWALEQEVATLCVT